MPLKQSWYNRNWNVMIPHTQISAILKTTSTTHGQLYQAETFCLCFGKNEGVLQKRKKTTM